MLRQFQKLEFQGFTYQQNQNRGWATSLLLQNCATDTLLQDCHSDKCLAANILASQESLSCSQTLFRGDTSMSNSQTLYAVTSSGGSSQGQQMALRWEAKYKSQRKKCVPTEGREAYRSPKLGQHQKGLAEKTATRSEGLVTLARKSNELSP